MARNRCKVIVSQKSISNFFFSFSCRICNDFPFVNGPVVPWLQGPISICDLSSIPSGSGFRASFFFFFFFKHPLPPKCSVTQLQRYRWLLLHRCPVWAWGPSGCFLGPTARKTHLCLVPRDGLSPKGCFLISYLLMLAYYSSAFAVGSVHSLVKTL